MVIVDTDGTIALVNAQAEKMFGYKREEFLGQPVEMLVPPRFRDSHRVKREQYNQRPSFRPMGVKLQLLGVRKDGNEFPVEVSLGPIDTEEGVLIASDIRDITDRTRAEEEARKQRDELEQVFNAFFSTKQEGMGMGLPISRSIVEAHSGRLWAKPNTGPGVTFGFTIPLEDRNGK